MGVALLNKWQMVNTKICLLHSIESIEWSFQAQIGLSTIQATIHWSIDQYVNFKYIFLVCTKDKFKRINLHVLNWVSPSLCKPLEQRAFEIIWVHFLILKNSNLLKNSHEPHNKSDYFNFNDPTGIDNIRTQHKFIGRQPWNGIGQCVVQKP